MENEEKKQIVQGLIEQKQQKEYYEKVSKMSLVELENELTALEAK